MSRTIDLSKSEYSQQPPMLTDESGQGQLDFGFDEPEFLQDDCRDREDAPSSVPTTRRTGPLRNVDPKKVNTAWQLIEQLSPGLPSNEYDLPIFIYRPDMLDYAAIARSLAAGEHDTTPTLVGPAQAPVLGTQEMNAMLEAAIVPLSYNEGFPVLPSGMPFWTQLEYEPKEAYDAFVNYLELGGARQISQLIAYNLDELKEYYHMYYWTHRVKAFDLYKVAHHQKVKLQRMLATEDSHYRTAERLMRKLETYFEGVTFDEDNISPEKAVGILEKLVKIQRVSVGLPANGESKENPGNERTVTPVNVIMQQISQNKDASKTKQGNDVDLLLEDPDAVELAQELIIKMQGGQ
jgi:hypothetical protein